MSATQEQTISTLNQCEQPIGSSETVTIHLLWLSRELDHSQHFICPAKPKSQQQAVFSQSVYTSTKITIDESDQSDSDKTLIEREENYHQLLDSALAWLEENPAADVMIWYDSQRSTPQQVKNTQTHLAELSKDNTQLTLRDIRTLSIVKNNPDCFSDLTGFYFKIDLLKLILLHASLSSTHNQYAVFSDIGVKPIPLLNAKVIMELSLCGVITNDLENQFIQTKNCVEVIRSLALVINKSLKRCYLGLQAKNQELKSRMLSEMYTEVYDDTIDMFHFLSHGFLNGHLEIDISSISNGCAVWQRLDSRIDVHQTIFSACTNDLLQTALSNTNLPAKKACKMSLVFDRMNRDLKTRIRTDVVSLWHTRRMQKKRQTLEEYSLNADIHRGRRDDIVVPIGREHKEQIVSDEVLTQKDVCLLPTLVMQTSTAKQLLLFEADCVLFACRNGFAIEDDRKYIAQRSCDKVKKTC